MLSYAISVAYWVSYFLYFTQFVREILIYIFSRQYNDPSDGILGQAHNPASVAIFYTICNDFDEGALNSLLNIAYENKHVFVLDDSRTNAVEDILRSCYDCPIVTYVRRGSLEGHKAGNINFTLRNLDRSYQYIFLADAEQRASKSCLRVGVAFLERNPEVVFAQWTHQPVLPTDSDLPQHIASAYGLHSEKEMRWRALLDTVPSIGHGVLIRRSVLDQTGGLPEIVSEDFAWSLGLLASRRRGKLLNLVGFTEGFPTSFLSFSSRFERWSRADYECAVLYLRAVVQSASIPLLTRVDSTIRQLKYVLAAFVLPFALLTLLRQDAKWPMVTSALSVASMMVPVLSATRTGTNRLRAFVDLTFICYTQSWVLLSAIRQSLVGKRPEFLVTNDSQPAVEHTPYRTHLILAVILIGLNLISFHPLVLFLAIGSLGYAIHIRQAWNSFLAVAVRYLFFAYLITWIILAYCLGESWMTELSWLITASTIIV